MSPGGASALLRKCQVVCAEAMGTSASQVASVRTGLNFAARRILDSILYTSGSQAPAWECRTARLGLAPPRQEPRDSFVPGRAWDGVLKDHGRRDACPTLLLARWAVAGGSGSIG